MFKWEDEEEELRKIITEFFFRTLLNREANVWYNVI